MRRLFRLVLGLKKHELIQIQFKYKNKNKTF